MAWGETVTSTQADGEGAVASKPTASITNVMLAQGIDVRTVADVLGHADVSTTLRTYVHSTEGATRRAATAMGAALSSRSCM